MQVLLFLLPIFEIGFLGDLGFSALFGGGLSAYAALRKDSVGMVTRKVTGRQANRAALYASEVIDYVEKEFEVSDTVKKGAIDTVSKVRAEIQKKL